MVYWKPAVALVIFLSRLLAVCAVESSLRSVILFLHPTHNGRLSFVVFQLATMSEIRMNLLLDDLTLGLRMDLNHPVLAEVVESTVLLRIIKSLSVWVPRVAFCVKVERLAFLRTLRGRLLKCKILVSLV